MQLKTPSTNWMGATLVAAESGVNALELVGGVLFFCVVVMVWWVCTVGHDQVFPEEQRCDDVIRFEKPRRDEYVMMFPFISVGATGATGGFRLRKREEILRSWCW